MLGPVRGPIYLSGPFFGPRENPILPLLIFEEAEDFLKIFPESGMEFSPPRRIENRRLTPGLFHNFSYHERAAH